MHFLIIFIVFIFNNPYYFHFLAILVKFFFQLFFLSYFLNCPYYINIFNYPYYICSLIIVIIFVSQFSLLYSFFSYPYHFVMIHTIATMLFRTRLLSRQEGCSTNHCFILGRKKLKARKTCYKGKVTQVLQKILVMKHCVMKIVFYKYLK